MRDVIGRIGAGGLLCAAVLSLPGPSRARADVGTDPERAIMGRTSYPARSWVLETESEYDARKLHDETQDAFSQSVLVERGLTDAWNLAAGARSKDRRRGATAADFAVFEVRRQLIPKPLDLSVYGRYEASIRGGPDQVSGGFEAVKNVGRWGMRIIYQAEAARRPGQARRDIHHINVGPYYRFGLQGMAGLTLHQNSLGASEARFSLASALSEKLFLGVEPRLGLSRTAPDLGLDLTLSLYFGEFSLGEWLLD